LTKGSHSQTIAAAAGNRRAVPPESNYYGAYFFFLKLDLAPAAATAAGNWFSPFSLSLFLKE